MATTWYPQGPKIPVTSGSGPYLVRWVDYKGNVLKSQFATAGQTLSAPTPPAFSGLTWSDWSGSSVNIQSDIDIIGVWTPTDGKRTLFVEASALVGLTPVLKVVKSDTSTLTVDWGDGTTSESSASGAVTITKDTPYVAGSYQIKPYISSGAGTFSGGHGTNVTPMLAGVAVTEYWATPDVTEVAEYAFNGTAFQTMAYATGFVAATSIGAYALQSCYALVSFSAPSATSIGARALQYCHALVSFSASSAKSIGANALQYCHALVSFSAPSATSIGANALQGCQCVTSFTIGPGCTLIDAAAISSLRNLRTLTIQAAIPPTLASVASIADFDPRMLIYVPSASVAAYQAETNWSTFAARIVGY